MIQMTPEQLQTIILGIFGVALQLLFLYGGKFAAWYQNHSNKGMLAVAFSTLIGAIYFALACSPVAAQFNISLSCSPDGGFALIKAIYLIAITQTATFVVLPKYKK